MNQIDLKDKVAIITGGAQGFGYSMVERFSKSGAKVVIWDKDEELLKTLTLPENASYELVGDDLGRVNFHDLKQNLPLGALIECIPPHCYATLNLYNVFHCVRDDKLVDIWPISSAKNW